MCTCCSHRLVPLVYHKLKFYLDSCIHMCLMYMLHYLMFGRCMYCNHLQQELVGQLSETDHSVCIHMDLLYRSLFSLIFDKCMCCNHQEQELVGHMLRFYLGSCIHMCLMYMKPRHCSGKYICCSQRVLFPRLTMSVPDTDM